MSKRLQVLVLEDVEEDAELMVRQLRLAQFDPQWERVEREPDYLARLRADLDLILADYTLPQFDALRALGLLKERGWDVPFIIVSGSIGEEVAVQAVRGGATDYLLKDRLARLGPAVANALEQKKLRDEKRQADQLVRERERHFRLLAENSTDMISLHTSAGICLYVSPACRTLLGYEPEELVGRSPDEFVHPDDLAAMWESSARSGQPDIDTVTYRIRHQGGHYVWFETTVRIVRAPASGEVLEFQASSRDVTERRQAEEERVCLLAQVQEQALQMRQVLDAVPEGVLLIDAGGRVVLANPMATISLAFFANARVGDVLTRLGNRPLAELLAPPASGSWHEVVADGHYFEVTARPIGASSEPEGWVVVLRDATQEREIERHLQQQDRLAAVGQLAAGIAHDFNNVLAVIVLYSQMLHRAPGLSPKHHQHLATIHQQARHAARLIEQILDFSRRSAMERSLLDLLPFLKELVKLLERTLPETIHLELRGAQREYLVHADPTRLQQALTNLAVNARDAMPQGGLLRLELEQVEVADSRKAPLAGLAVGGWVRLTVADSGVGIAPELLDHIFEPFFTTKEPGRGTGLGLAQVYGIVKQHGGEITVDSRVGQGTAFTLYLPVAEIPAAELSLPEGETVPAAVRGETILLVEDSESTRGAVQEMLGTLGYRVLVAQDGQEALAVWERHAEGVALVLSDLVMPRMGGVELYQALKGRKAGVKFAILTGYPLEDGGRSLLAQGIGAWIAKPFSVESIAHKVRAALDA